MTFGIRKTIPSGETLYFVNIAENERLREANQELEAQKDALEERVDVNSPKIDQNRKRVGSTKTRIAELQSRELEKELISPPRMSILVVWTRLTAKSTSSTETTANTSVSPAKPVLSNTPANQCCPTPTCCRPSS